MNTESKGMVLTTSQSGTNQLVKSQLTERDMRNYANLQTMKEEYDLANSSLKVEKKITDDRKRHLTKIVKDRAKTIKLTDKLLAKGYEIASPPQNWYCGYLRISRFGVVNKDFEKMAKACKNARLFGMEFGNTIKFKKFLGFVPEKVFDTYWGVHRMGVKEEHIVITSPDNSLFEDVLVRDDPIMFAYVPEANLWFRLAVWDIAKDLEQLEA